MADDGFHSQVKGSSLLLLDNSSDTTARRFRPGSRLAEKSVLVERIPKKGVIVNILKLCLSPKLIRQLCQL